MRSGLGSKGALDLPGLQRLNGHSVDFKKVISTPHARFSGWRARDEILRDPVCPCRQTYQSRSHGGRRRGVHRVTRVRLDPQTPPGYVECKIESAENRGADKACEIARPGAGL